ncbi:LysR substrate-binding domain-containing protein [Geomicrobium sp. JCM 19037]|uniref:LysR substrate-binding domain-containing protein n=1 Tax=Geomicrobium sp. JCM 19037 TaxID=1460634 RepID=UPI0027D8A140|nr:LysR substrate-binding domain-containing protein [Geomicrobium sp. JCM 19037]
MVAEYGQKNSRKFALGVSSTFSYYRLPEILKKFMEEFPNIQVEVTTGWSSAILKKLEDEKYTLALSVEAMIGKRIVFS